MIQSNILLTDVIIPKYDKFTQVKANNQSDTDIPVYDNAIPTNLSLNTNSPSNDDVLPTYETITLSPLIPGTGSIFPTDVNLLPKITNLNDLLAHLSEVQIRFNSNPDYYMQDDFALLIKTITESLINIYVNTPVTVDEFQSLEDLVDTKVDKINNKSLSTNDYSDEDKLKLDGIENGANVNVQSDWLASTGDSKILNKPEIPSLTGIATEEYVISYAQIKKGIGEYYINLDEKNSIHEPHSDDQDLSGLVVKIPGYSLVANSEIAKIHAAGSDDQDLSAYETTFNNNAKLINKVDKIFGYSLVSNADIANIHPPHLDDQDLSIYETILNNNSKLESKVDKIIGYGLSETNFTQAEKTKLALLESSHYKGRYLSLGALQIAYPLANAGDYARIDGGVGIDVTTYIWDDNDTKWILESGGGGTAETATSIKTKYESNPDTNVFDNNAKNKLAGIFAGAQVNVLEGVQRNGVDLGISNKKVNVIVPTIPGDIGAEPANINIQTHISSTNNPHSVTKTQLGLGNLDNTSDLNKPISTVTQTALNAKEPIITSGTTGQYWRGDKSWQTLNASTIGLGSVENTALSSWIGSSNITTLGAITTGTWTATIISAQYGGTGVNNSGKTITLAGNLITSGAFALTLTSTGITNVTLPTTGTLATIAGTEALINKTFNGISINALASGFTVSGGTTSKTLTVSGTSDISGTNSGDETITTIKTKLGITTLSGSNTGDQDLSSLLSKNGAITAATKTKITYDINGLVTSGSDATTNDISSTTDKRYVTDSQLTLLGNLSGSNSGDNAVNTLYSGLATSKQDLLVSGTSIKTINGNSLLGSGDITIIAGESTPITGTVAIAMGNEESSKIITINDSTITLASLKEYAFINIETSETSLDDFTLNGLSFGIENIVDNVSFDIRANATNNASGDYTIKYIITI